MAALPALRAWPRRQLLHRSAPIIGWRRRPLDVSLYFIVYNDTGSTIDLQGRADAPGTACRRRHGARNARCPLKAVESMDGFEGSFGMSVGACGSLAWWLKDKAEIVARGWRRRSTDRGVS